MRGLRRAYDPHLAACRLAFIALFAFGLGLGQYPSLRGGGGQVGNRPRLRGAALGALWGCTLLLPGGLSRELHACPASAGNILGCGLRVLGVAPVGGQGWFGEAPERPVFFVVLLPALCAGGAHHRSKGRRQGGNFPSNLTRIYP
jgi:hypothetical protein